MKEQYTIPRIEVLPMQMEGPCAQSPLPGPLPGTLPGFEPGQFLF